MDSDHGDRAGRVPLRAFGGPGWDHPADSGHPADPAGLISAERSGAGHDGLRHARRVSNWTAAAVIAGAGAAAVALAHQSAPATGTAAPAHAAGTATGTAGGGAGAAGARGAPSASAPRVTHSVTTTSPSGITVTTTTTRSAGGKTVVTRVRHVPAYTDN